MIKMEDRRWIWWLVVIVAAVVVIVGGALLWRSRSEQVRVKQIQQEVQQAEEEELKEKREAIMRYGPPTGR